MLADFFTKSLQGKQFKLLRSAVRGWISLDQLKSSLTEKSIRDTSTCVNYDL